MRKKPENMQVGGVLPELKPIKNWIICGAGFTQKASQWDQGIPALCRYLHEQYAGPDLRVEFFHWNEDWTEKADWIFGASGGATARILCVDYSWSVGNGYLRLAREFKDRGQRIERAIFADGVYHYGGSWMHKIGLSQLIACMPRLTRWRPEIAIPNNVDQVDWFVQSPKNFRYMRPRETWLRGHRIVWEDTKQEVPGRVDVEGVIHHWMDEGEDFQNHVMRVAKEMFGDVPR